MSALETFLVGLAVVIYGGVTTLAFHRREDFRKLLPFLTVAPWVLIAVIVIWNWALLAGSNAAWDVEIAVVKSGLPGCKDTVIYAVNGQMVPWATVFIIIGLGFG